MSDDSEEEIPRWLSSLLSEKFFNACITHEDAKRNEKNVFCLICCEGICEHCVSHHRSHRLLQIRRYVYNNVISFDDGNELIDCTQIQSNTVNGAKVVFLNERPHARPPPKSTSSNHCKTCDRNLRHPFLFCSISCKVEHFKNGDSEEETPVVKAPRPTTKQNRPQSTTGQKRPRSTTKQKRPRSTIEQKRPRDLDTGRHGSSTLMDLQQEMARLRAGLKGVREGQALIAAQVRVGLAEVRESLDLVAARVRVGLRHNREGQALIMSNFERLCRFQRDSMIAADRAAGRRVGFYPHVPHFHTVPVPCSEPMFESQSDDGSTDE